MIILTILGLIVAAAVGVAVYAIVGLIYMSTLEGRLGFDIHGPNWLFYSTLVLWPLVLFAELSYWAAVVIAALVVIVAGLSARLGEKLKALRG